MDCSKIRGFNYQPSYGTNGFELWQKFDGVIIDRELGFGKKYFPKMNAIRLWISWNSFNRNPEKFSGNFEATLKIADKYGLVVMPVLFNRWHDSVLDYGGIYNTCKKLGAKSPITIGIHPGQGLKGIQQIEPISDILSIHPYWTADSPPHEKSVYEKLLDEYVSFANEIKKPLLATETCWGST